MYNVQDNTMHYNVHTTYIVPKMQPNIVNKLKIKPVLWC